MSSSSLASFGVVLSGKANPSDFARHKRARYRYTEHSSSDSSDAGTFLVSNVKFRSALGFSLNDQAEIIAKAEGVEPLSVDLVSRYIEGSAPNEGRVTILIVANWSESSPSIWERIVKKTKKFVDAAIRNRYLEDVEIGVEMIAEELTLAKYITPIPASDLTDAFCEDWQHITEGALDILDSYPATKSRVTSIALFKLGFSTTYEDNPSTVYISVNYESEENHWPPVVGEIQQLLNRYPYKLQVHMEHNTSSKLCPSLFPLVNRPMTDAKRQMWPAKKYKNLVGLGEDIGPECYIKVSNSGDDHSPGFGTLGCWVEIKTIKEPGWTKYALTNYHVVRPAFKGFQLGTNDKDEASILKPVKDSDLWKVDINGIGPKFDSKAAEIEHPARIRHCFTVQLLTERIENHPDHPVTAGFIELLDEAKSFFDNNKQHLGSIFCASGYTRRTANDGRLDWALIKPTGTGVARIGKNSLPTCGDWENRGYITRCPWDRGTLEQPPAHGLRSIPNGGLIFKVGAATGATGGMFSTIKPRVHFKEDAHVEPWMKSRHRPYLSNEFMYIGLPEVGWRWLAKQGDSGSVVFDTQGKAAGLLFRGHTAQQATSSYAYITPIEDVFADIKAFSKGEITDICIAED
ncbi:hypothetical protein B0T25DRAFT_618478 [Lasiosphaeria hispida]|uniref:Serine protease n=1 Tax=Lasiosphaeria hispida TaxID=260671 RepID=A0AAJ0M7T4_9PEZI|nr:hypothetical protein B0T25DRAFT_618478 [Lasiosphaeria hispida]